MSIEPGRRDSVFGHQPGAAVERMRSHIAGLTERPLRYTQLSPRMVGVAAGSEIWPSEMTIALNPNNVNDYLLGHEMAHLIVGLESPHLAIQDDFNFPRGSPNRHVLGLLISCFEHSIVYDLMRSYGIDTSHQENAKVQDYLREVRGIAGNPYPAPFFFQNLAVGYADLHRQAPHNRAWSQIRDEWRQRHKLTLDNAKLLERAVSDKRVANRDFRGMFDAVASAWAMAPVWRNAVVDIPPARDSRSG